MYVCIYVIQEWELTGCQVHMPVKYHSIEFLQKLYSLGIFLEESFMCLHNSHYVQPMNKHMDICSQMWTCIDPLFPLIIMR